MGVRSKTVFVGVLTVELFCHAAMSLKDKRRVLRSLLDRLRGRYNVACAEVDGHDRWQVATIGIASVSNSANHLQDLLAGVLRFIQSSVELEVMDHQVEIW
ncbi:MAG: hypothetical protein XD69_0327 [Clostridia bacterium 62_21]|nr:MAG: hypothetical protein XD69_0327 [Clostridia bacterium 62_21]HAG07715.1 DUF503 domain-containing protein [Peptococcaceae bacterium]